MPKIIHFLLHTTLYVTMLYVTNLYVIYLIVFMRITTEIMYNLFIYNLQFKEPGTKNQEQRSKIKDCGTRNAELFKWSMRHSGLTEPQTFQTSNSSNVFRSNLPLKSVLRIFYFKTKCGKFIPYFVACCPIFIFLCFQTHIQQ